MPQHKKVYWHGRNLLIKEELDKRRSKERKLAFTFQFSDASSEKTEDDDAIKRNFEKFFDPPVK